MCGAGWIAVGQRILGAVVAGHVRRAWQVENRVGGRVDDLAAVEYAINPAAFLLVSSEPTALYK
ncbi:MAG: hypothetical protein A2087_05345 [Spirochaetes bacterium GWD1_61_31]|nr:MAG: hypothetical protein A2Y37_10590 [Spirochaetes bacterium GWB1_60_80]OHD29769.1 MAG: hypothetical protein A2004_04865 [Spirochaetes bacterium GWC1_61_12]OHD42889.1 MAG: hypothetical protein A2Y35_13925 [Spirochaetes bacterium GWE1_60_18]OHD43466.1 MAG: hypothetical protein A2087_05345 [Spirochaetes bacterium GWD1_61_31]OHD59573.1 MAG: hypothetical protein A2Y32_12630 [Spirochaetes bacterium GWF1_60_12]HAP43753.1 hypothetical protein [Spirochaetaceae bacterium]